MVDTVVMLRSGKPVITYEVYDDQGRSVGCVILPRSSRVVGQSEGTVLLRRSMPSQHPPLSPKPRSRDARSPELLPAPASTATGAVPAILRV